MNQARRKAIQDFQNTISKEKGILETARDGIEEADDPKAIFEQARSEVALITDDLEAIRDEEQEYFDNMPEGLQNSERGETASGNVEQMDEAIEKLTVARESLDKMTGDESREDLETCLNELIDAIEEADEALDDAQN